MHCSNHLSRILTAGTGIVLLGVTLGCGGSSGASQEERTMKFGSVLTRVVGTAQPPVAASGFGAVATGLAGANISALTLNDTVPTLAETKIAFASGATADEQLYLMDPDGSNRIALTSNRTQRNFDPAWSPDGSKIAFSRQIGSDMEIWLINADGTGERQLTNATGFSHVPAWSPDGTKIAFSSNRTGNREIFVVNADGTNPVNLTNNASDDEDPTWSPDGTQIAFDRSSSIFVMNSNGSGQRNLNANGFGPSWSPDGLHIAFSSFRDGVVGTGNIPVPEIYVMSYAGFSQTRLTNNTVYDSKPKWSPDSTRIVWNGGGGDIDVMNPDGSAQTRIAGATDFVYSPAWSPFVRTRPIIGPAGSMGTNAAGFLFASRGKTTSSILTFDAVNRAAARVDSLSSSLPAGSPNLLFSLTIGDHIASLLYSNDFFRAPVQVIATGDSGNTGALVYLDSSDGKVTAVLPYAANRSATAAPRVQAAGDTLIIHGAFVGAWDRSGRNVARGGAMTVRIGLRDGSLAVVQ